MKPRVGVVIDPWDFPYNGTVVSTRRFVTAMADDFDFTLLAIGGVAAPCAVTAFDKLSLPGVNRIIDRMRVPLARPDAARIERVLDKIDVLHVQFPFFLGFAAARRARRRGIPVICSFHVQPENLLRNLGVTWQWPVGPLYRLFNRAFYARADAVVTPSEFAAGALRAHGLTRAVRVISNGVPDALLGQPRSMPAAERFRVLSVGRLAAEKRQQVIIDAVAQSRFRHLIVLRLIGAGPLQGKLRAHAEARGVQAHIGPASEAELLDAYAACDLFVHAGEVELEGMSVMEAMATENTTVVADAGDSAASELTTGRCASFQAGSAAHLAERIDYWLANPQARAERGRLNKQWVSQRAHQASCALLAALYREMAGVC